MISPLRAAVGIGAVVIAIAGTAMFVRGPSGIGGPSPTVSPALSPTSAAEGSQAPADWPRYTSAQYGFTIGHPSDWTLRKAYRPWSIEEDLNDVMLSAGADGFLSADEYLYVNAWMTPLAAGQSDAEWLAAVCPTCGDLPARAITVDGHPGSLVTGVSESLAYVFADGKVYVFGVWRPGYEPLLEQFLSTVRLP